MQLFQETGLKRLEDFIGIVQTYLKNFRGAYSFEILSCFNLLVSNFITHNDVTYWKENNKVFRDFYKKIANNKGIYTPDIYDAESKQLFNDFLVLLKDIRDNWSDYIPLFSRAALRPLGVYERVVHAIKFMENQLDLYQRRERSIAPNKIYDEIKTEIAALFSDCVTKIQADKLNQAEINARFSTLFGRILSLPMTQELQCAVDCVNPDDYHAKNKDSHTSRGRCYLLEILVAKEMSLNYLLIEERRKPIFSFVTTRLQTATCPQKMMRLKANVASYITALMTQLNDYQTNDGHERKKLLARELLSLVISTHELDPASRCLDVRRYALEFQRRHSEILEQESISSGMFGALLDDALAAFARIEQTFEVANDMRLARLVSVSLDVIQSEPESCRSLTA